jgi:hypothetical protein
VFGNLSAGPLVGPDKGHLLSSLPCMSQLCPSSSPPLPLLARLWSALLLLAPLLSADPHPLPHWSGQGSTLSNWLPCIKQIPSRSLLNALMMEAASTPEMLVNFYQTTWCNIPEDSHLHTRHHENLKSHQKQDFLQLDGDRVFRF